MAENSVRHINTIKELESLKYEYQIRCSHYRLEYSSKDNVIICSICGKIVEHREVKSRPTILNEDFTLQASKEKNAPITLVRLILLDGKLSEREIVTKIYKLATFSASLAIITILIQFLITMK